MTVLTIVPSAVQQVLAQKAQLAKAIKLEQAEAKAEFNRTYARHANQEFDNLLGDMRAELAQYIYGAGHTEDKNGFWTGVQWSLKSDELALAPIMVNCEVRIRDESVTVRSVCNLINCGNGKSWYEVTPDAFADVLWAAHAAYPAWKARQDEEEAKKQRQVEDERQRQISNLCYRWAWTAHNNSEADVLGRYEQLRAFDPVVADAKLAFYRENAKEYAKEKEAERKKREVAAAVWAEYDERYAEWEAACQQWMETEQKRLWAPWTLWKVRYAPLDLHLASVDEEGSLYDLIETVHTLDQPERFANARPARLTRVDAHGKTSEFVIGALLDAERIDYDEPTGNHHRCYRGGNKYTDEFAVYVPPFVIEEPTPAPEKPKTPDCARPVDEVAF